MTSTTQLIAPESLSLEDLVAETIQRKLAVTRVERRLKPLVDELKRRAAVTLDESGDPKITFTDKSGLSVVLIQPAPKHVSIDDPAAMKKLCGDHFSTLFAKEISYKAIEGFDLEVEELLPKTRGEMVISLATEPSTLRLNYELKGEA